MRKNVEWNMNVQKILYNCNFNECENLGKHYHYNIENGCDYYKIKERINDYLISIYPKDYILSFKTHTLNTMFLSSSKIKV